MATIYLLTFPNGKKYVGQTTQVLAERLWQHKSAIQHRKHNIVLYRAWEAHGDPEVAVLHECAVEELNDLEIQAIKDHGTLVPNGYNLSPGGGQFSVSYATRVKMAAAKRGRFVSQETRDKLSASKMGNKMSAEARARSAYAHRGRKMPVESVARSVAARTGVPKSAEARAKTSATLRALYAKRKAEKEIPCVPC